MILIADSYTRREKLVVIETGKTEEGTTCVKSLFGVESLNADIAANRQATMNKTENTRRYDEI